jgi:hypothetical protein
MRPPSFIEGATQQSCLPCSLTVSPFLTARQAKIRFSRMLRPQRNPGSRVWTFRHPAAFRPARPPRRDIEFVRRLSVALSTRTPSASVISTYRELASSLVQPNRTESSQNDSISYSPSGTATRNALDKQRNIASQSPRGRRLYRL